MTTRFLFITDTHLGAVNEVGYLQQPRRVDRLPELLALLESWVAQDAERQSTQGGAPVSFVLHGGDMVDAATPETLRSAAETFHLSVPVYLSLGNHDLTRRDAADLWLAEAPAFFPGGEPAYSLDADGWMIHVVPTQWCDTPYFWADEQAPHLLPEHLIWLEAALSAHCDTAHLLCTHGEVLGVPAAQAGTVDPLHSPRPAYTESVTGLLTRFPQLKGVLGGHNHINTHSVTDQAHLVTGSALTETPFEFKVVEVSPEGWSVETVALLPTVTFRADYDWDKTFVQGRRCDRQFATRFRG